VASYKFTLRDVTATLIDASRYKRRDVFLSIMLHIKHIKCRRACFGTTYVVRSMEDVTTGDVIERGHKISALCHSFLQLSATGFK
jgi:hypothetical protein